MPSLVIGRDKKQSWVTRIAIGELEPLVVPPLAPYGPRYHVDLHPGTVPGADYRDAVAAAVLRIRSRDVLDLWHFVRAGRGVAEIIESAQQASTTATAHRAFAVLRGDLPLDAMDEGFKSLAPEIDMTKVYADFRVWTDAYEQDIAHAIKLRSAP